MRIYLNCPPPSVLVAHAFEKFQEARSITLYAPVTRGGQQDFDITTTVHPERAEGATMNFELSYLWDLLKQDQSAWELAHRGVEPEYVS